MTSNFQQAPYLREQRAFPSDDVSQLADQIDHAYIDIASKVNARIIGLYSNNFNIVTGEKWYFSGSSTPQQSLRQFYSFNSTGSIPHGLNWNSVASISPRSYGSFTDGTNWYGTVFAGSTAIAAEVSFYITDQYIVILAGASAPTIQSGIINLEWISQF